MSGPRESPPGPAPVDGFRIRERKTAKKMSKEGDAMRTNFNKPRLLPAGPPAGALASKLVAPVAPGPEF
ncbi:hypothetical protein BH20ACT23_BH20ACT23_20540 [soil metagenome]